MAYRLTTADRRALAQMRARELRNKNGYRAVKSTAPKAQTSGKNNNDKYKDANPLLKGVATAYDVSKNVSRGIVKFGEGIVDFGAGIVGAVGSIFDDGFEDNLKDFIETDWTSKYYDSGAYEFFIPGLKDLDKYSYTNDSKGGQIVESVAQGVGQMLPGIALTIATGGTGAGALTASTAQTINAIALGVSAGGNATEEAFNDGAGYYEGLGYGAVSGGVEWATEKLLPGVGDLVIGKSFLKGIGKGAGEVAQQGGKRILRQTLTNALNEGAEEMVSEVTNPLRKTIYKGKDALKEYGEGEFWAGVGEAGAVGALTSVAMTPVVGATSKALGHNADIDASVEKIGELNKKKSLMQRKGTLTNEAEAQIDASIEANLKQIESVLGKADANTRAKYMESYKQAFDNRFSDDGVLNEKAADTSGLDKQYYSVSARGHESEIKASLDREGVKAYHGELTEQESNNLREVYQAHEKLNELGYAGKHVVIVESMEKSNAFLDKNIIAIGKDMLENGEHIKKLIHETTHFTEGSKEWHSVAKFVFGKDTKNIRTALKAELDLVLDSGYGVTQADVDAVIAHIESGYETKLTEKQGLLIQEVVANRMEKMFGDMKSIERLCRENKNIAKQIWERIKALIEVFGKTHSEREEIKKLRETERLFRAALETGGQDYIRGEIENAAGEATTGIQFSKKISEYPYDMQHVIKDYLESVDSILLEKAKEHKADRTHSFERIEICDVDEDLAKQIGDFFDRDYIGSSVNINSNAFNHIEKRHGENGQQDSSMQDLNDVARIGYVIKNRDSIEPLLDEKGNQVFSSEFGTKDNTPAPLVMIKKKINGTYYCVLAASDSKYKKIWVQTAFINKKDGLTQVLRAEIDDLGVTSETPLASHPSVTSISQNSEKSTPETKKSRKVQHSYKGRNAADADMTLYERAEAMEAEGAESEAIRKETGWFKSFDGEWRYEIDDSRMRYLKPTLDAEGFTTLGELIEHEALFKAYPQLRDLKVEVKADTKYNYYSPGRKKIVLMETVFEDGDFKKSQDKKLSGKTILIHEIQHAIQHIEGFARGTSPSEWRQVLRERRKKVGVIVKGKTQKAVQRITEKYGDEVGQDARRYIDLAILEGRDKITKAELEELDVVEFDLEMILGEDFDIIDKALMKEAEYINSLRSIKGDAELDYYNTAGEIEAYDVGERVDLDAETRRAVRPDIDRNPDDVKFADPTKWRKMHSEDAGEDKYTYNELIAKGDIPVITLVTELPLTKEGEFDYKAIIAKGRENARKQNNPNNTATATYVYVEDIGLDVLIGAKGLQHGLARSEETAYAVMTIGDILKNSIVVNELNGSPKRGTDMSYVLLSACQNDGKLYVARSVVSKLTNNVTEIDVYQLGAVKGKKIELPNSALGGAAVTEQSSLISSGTLNISIADFLEYVKSESIANESFSKNVADKLGVKRSKGTISPDIKYSRKGSDNSGSERKVLLPVRNRERFKIYTQENAEQIVSSIVQNVLRFNDGTQGVIKNKAELVDMIWRRLNTADPGKRGGVALDIAEEIIQRTAVRTVIDDPANAEYVEEVSAIKPYMHSFNLSTIKAELEHRFGKNEAKGIMLAWGARKGERGITADSVAQELESAGIRIKAETEADIFFEIYDTYKKASDALKKKATVMLDSVIAENERKQLKQDIAKEILDGFNILGKKSVLANLIEKEKANSRIWKEQYYDSKHRAKAINHLFETVDRVRNIVDMKKADAEIAEEVENIVKLLKKIKTTRGNIAKNVRDIMKSYASNAGDSKVKLYDLITDKLDGEINPFAEQIEAIANGNGELSTREIEALDSILRNFIHNANNYKRVFLEGKVQEAKDVIEQGLSETSEALAVKNDGVFGFGNRVKESMQSPVWRFERLGCYRKDSVMMKLWRELQSGFSRQAAFEMRSAEHFRQFFEKNKKTVNKWRDATYELDGAKVSRGQMIGLYLTSLREQGRGHLFGESDNGVVRFTNEKVAEKRGAHFAELEGKDLRITQSDIVEFEKTLTETEREFIALAQTFFNEISKNAKVETDEALYGVTNVVDANYYPLRVADDQIYKRLGDGTFRFADLFNLYSPSFNKATVDHANNKLIIENVIDVINRHSKQMANYYGFARAVKTFNRVYNMKLDKNGPSMRDAIHKVDMRFEEYVGRLIQDIQGNRVYKSGVQRVVSKLRGWGAKAALGWNLKVLVSQFVSMPASAAVGFKYRNIVKGFTLVVSRKTNYEKMFEYCPMLYDRFRNGNNIDVGLLKEGRGILDNLDWLTDFTTAPIGKIDALVCCAIWNAALEQTKGSYEAYSDAHYKAAAELTEQAVIKTQANYAPLYRSDILRNQDSFVQLMTMFMGEPLQQFSLLSSAIEKMYVTRHLMKNAQPEQRAEYEQVFKQGKKEAARALTAVFIDTLILTAIAQLFKWVKGKEDEDKVKGIIGDFTENYVGMFPIIKDVYGYIMNGYDMTNMAYTGFTNIADGITAISEMIDLFASGEAYDETKVRQKTRKVLLGISQTFGIPLRNLETYAKGIIEKIWPEGVYQYESKFYGASVSQYTKDLAKAIEDGDDELADTILDIMLDESGTDITLRREMRTLITKGYKVIPKSVGEKVTYNGEEIVLTKKQKARFKELYAVGNQSAAELVKLPLYKKADEQASAKALKFIYDTYYNLALQEALGLDLEGKNVLFAEALDIEQLAIIVGIASTIEADVDRKGNVISGSRKAKLEKYVESLPLKAAQKYMIMGYLGYKNKNGEAQVKAYISRLSLTKDEKAQLLEYSGYAA